MAFNKMFNLYSFNITGAVRLFGLAGVLLALAGCAVGPDYVRPEVNIGKAYKSAQVQTENAGWIMAQPHEVINTSWWEVFNDAELNNMMLQLESSNFDLQRAEAQYRIAQASLKATESGLFPELGWSAGVNRSGAGGANVQNQYSTSASASWEVDLWGRVRRSVEASEAGLQASVADLAATKLSLQASLAQTYFRLQKLHLESALMQETVQAYVQGLEITENRYAAGVANLSDVAAATTQLENAKGQLQSLGWQRAQLEHALAELQGLVPSAFNLNARFTYLANAPTIPVGVPSTLLQHRPDVAAAEQRIRQANANIGVAKSAWFPDLTLTAQGGYRSGQWAQWLTAPSQFWSLGPALALSMFDGGARQARIDEAFASYDAQAASYKQAVITALREVEDILVQLASMDTETQISERALNAANQALTIIRNQYQAGMVDYLSVVQVEASALSAQRALLALQADKLNLTVQLITALGGGWG